MNHSLSYKLSFFYYALRGIFRNQDLRFSSQYGIDETNFILKEPITSAWEKLFEVKLGAGKIPFTYYWPHYIKFYLKMMDNLGINYRNVLHLGHSSLFSRDPAGLNIGEKVSIFLGIEDIAWLDRDRCVIVTVCKIADENGSEICKTQESIFLKGLSLNNIEKLKHQGGHNKTDISHFIGLSKRSPVLSGPHIKMSQFKVPANFGSIYGNISGDLNPVHTKEWLAKVFGYPHAFVQGSATINFLFKFFIGEQGEKIERFNLTFCNPIFHDQIIQIRYLHDAFELIDKDSKLVAFGTRRGQGFR